MESHGDLGTADVEAESGVIGGRTCLPVDENETVSASASDDYRHHSERSATCENSSYNPAADIHPQVKKKSSKLGDPAQLELGTRASVPFSPEKKEIEAESASTSEAYGHSSECEEPSCGNSGNTPSTDLDIPVRSKPGVEVEPAVQLDPGISLSVSLTPGEIKCQSAPTPEAAGQESEHIATGVKLKTSSTAAIDPHVKLEPDVKVEPCAQLEPGTSLCLYQESRAMSVGHSEMVIDLKYVYKVEIDDDVKLEALDSEKTKELESEITPFLPTASTLHATSSAMPCAVNGTDCGVNYESLVHDLIKSAAQYSKNGSSLEPMASLKLGCPQESDMKKLPRQFPCPQCGAKFSYTSRLKAHMQTHTGIRPFPCSECGARFTRSFDLKRHLLTHNGQAQHMCRHCDAKFTRAKHLRTHIETHPECNPMGVYTQNHTREKKIHQCYECGAIFPRATDLNRHMLKHTGRKPHACTLCGSRFSRADHLKTHMVSHTGKKPYACSECGLRFTRSSNLKRHMQSHTGTQTS